MKLKRMLQKKFKSLKRKQLFQKNKEGLEQNKLKRKQKLLYKALISKSKKEKQLLKNKNNYW